MSRRRMLLVGSVLIVATLAIIGTSLSVWAKQKEDSGVGIWKLSTELVYDDTLRESQDALEQSGVTATLWSVQKNQLVENPDFGRTITVDVMAVAGDTSLLFPRCNTLRASEIGYCLLGSETARKLFGSTSVNGRVVRIAGRDYQVADIEYQQKELCIYELDFRDKQEVDHVSYHYGSREKKSITERMAQNVLGISEYTEEKWKYE